MLTFFGIRSYSCLTLEEPQHCLDELQLVRNGARDISKVLQTWADTTTKNRGGGALSGKKSCCKASGNKADN